jgi:hypothetical protein
MTMRQNIFALMQQLILSAANAQLANNGRKADHVDHYRVILALHYNQHQKTTQHIPGCAQAQLRSRDQGAVRL